EPRRGAEHHRPRGREGARRREDAGRVHERRDHQPYRARIRQRDRLGEFLGGADRHAPERWPPQRAGLRPDQPLGEAGRAAGVDDQLVVPAAGNAGRRVMPGDKRLEAQRFPGRPPLPVHLDGLHRQVGALDRGEHAVAEGLVIDDHARLRVLQQVAELLLAVAEVHVERHRAQLERREDGLHVLDAVAQVHGDRGPRADAQPGERRREARGPGVEVGPGSLALTVHDRHPLAYRVGDELPEAGEVVQHDGQGSTRADARPEKTARPSWFTVAIVTSTKCSPPSSRIASTVATAVSVSPGQTCPVNRPPKNVTRSAPAQSVSSLPVMPIVSMPCAKTDGLPAAAVANGSSVWSGLKSPDAPAYWTIWVR